MRPPRIVRTASFKLAALYALIFGVSVIVLAAVVYVISTTALDRQTRARIHSESRELIQEYRAGGLDHLLSVIRARQLGRLVGGLDYTVYDGAGHRIYGTLPHVATAAGWSQMTGPPDGDEPQGELERLIVYSVPLNHGYWLMIGDDIGKVEAVGRLIMTTFGSALVLMILFAAAGGIALSHRLSRPRRCHHPHGRGHHRRQYPAPHPLARHGRRSRPPRGHAQPYARPHHHADGIAAPGLQRHRP